MSSGSMIRPQHVQYLIYYTQCVSGITLNIASIIEKIGFLLQVPQLFSNTRRLLYACIITCMCCKHFTMQIRSATNNIVPITCCKLMAIKAANMFQVRQNFIIYIQILNIYIACIKLVLLKRVHGMNHHLIHKTIAKHII